MWFNIIVNELQTDITDIAKTSKSLSHHFGARLDLVKIGNEKVELIRG